MDDNQGYPYFRKPPYWLISNLACGPWDEVRKPVPWRDGWLVGCWPAGANHQSHHAVAFYIGITPIWSNADLQTFTGRDHHAPFWTWCMAKLWQPEKKKGQAAKLKIISYSSKKWNSNCHQLQVRSSNHGKPSQTRSQYALLSEV